MEIEAYLKKDYTTNLVNEGRREDGRAFDEYRKLITENGYVKEKAPGSCLVQLGKTKVLAGVSVDVGEPFPRQTQRRGYEHKRRIQADGIPALRIRPAK